MLEALRSGFGSHLSTAPPQPIVSQIVDELPADGLITFAASKSGTTASRSKRAFTHLVDIDG
jgi:hypothetical protein